MRPLVQYDLDDPPAAHSDPQPTAPQPNPHRPPAKKRKRNHAKPAQRASFQHWDDPGGSTVGVAYDEQEASATMSYVGEDEDGEENGDEGVTSKEEEESRQLTHDEIWDDSALIDAWNSAEAEYNAYHGTSKAWKTEPVKKSPLWYNKPYTAPGPSKPASRPKQATPRADGEPECDTAPLDFDTYVPTHDPSLAIPDNGSTTPAAQVPSFVPPPSTRMVSRDEAFNNALSAMYWSGYWTAVYHCQSQTSQESNNGPVEATEDEVEADDDEDLVPAQR